MNERIKLLAEQSGCDWWEGQGQRDMTRCQDELEKFAELIVQDCMAMSDELKAQYLTSRKSAMDFAEKNIYAEGEAACDILKYKMKRQFGVE